MAIDSCPRSGYQASAVRKAFRILDTIAESRRSLSLTELAKQSGCSKSTTHGLLQALLHVGAIQQTAQQKTFSLGYALVEMACKGDPRDWVGHDAQRILNELRDRIGESVFLGAASRKAITILATAGAEKPLFCVTSVPGITLPLLIGAVGKVIMAYHDDRYALRILRANGLPRFTSRAIVDEACYLEELRTVRKQGYAVDDGEYLPGVRAVAVGLKSGRGLSMALWVAGLVGSMDIYRDSPLIAETLRTARKLEIFLNNR